MAIGPSKGFMSKAFGKLTGAGSGKAADMMDKFKRSKKQVDIKPKGPGIFGRVSAKMSKMG